MMDTREREIRREEHERRENEREQMRREALEEARNEVKEEMRRNNQWMKDSAKWQPKQLFNQKDSSIINSKLKIKKWKSKNKCEYEREAMSLSKRTYMEAKLHLQYQSHKPARDAQQRELRGQSPFKRPRIAIDQRMRTLQDDSPYHQPIEDSDNDSWDDGGVVNTKPDFAAAFGFSDEEDDAVPVQEDVMQSQQPTEDIHDEAMLDDVDSDQEMRPTTNSSSSITKKEEVVEQMDVTKREADNMLHKIERQ